jgi:hypothetical protein
LTGSATNNPGHYKKPQSLLGVTNASMMQATRVSSALTFTPTIEQAKARVEAQVPEAFDNDVPLPVRVRATALHGHELLQLFQCILIFLAIDYDGWNGFWSKNISRKSIEEGFMLVYSNKIDECRTFMTEKLQPTIVESPQVPRTTFLEMRATNGLIPDPLLIAGEGAELYFQISNLVPEGDPDL